MAFWGVEVKSGKPYTHIHDLARGKLRITQATLGIGTSSKRTIVQCNVGNRGPVLLSSLIPDKSESCSLDLEFEEEDEVVFSVIGPRSVHLSGYYPGSGGGHGDDETDSYGEDIAESESNDSGSYDSEEGYEEDFIDDDDLEMFSHSQMPNSGVVIEEIVDDEKPENGATDHHLLRKKHQAVNLNNNVGSEGQIVVKQNHRQDLESDDEDGFPISLPSWSNSDEKNMLGDKKSDKTTEKAKQRKENISPVAAHRNSAQVQALEAQVENMDRNLFDKHKADEAENSGNPKKKKKKKKKNKAKKSETGNSLVDSSEDRAADNTKKDQNEDNKAYSSRDSEILAKGESEEQQFPQDKDASTIDTATVHTTSGKLDKIKKKRAKSEASQKEDEEETNTEVSENNEACGENNGDRNLSIGKSEKKKRKKKKSSTNDSPVEKESVVTKAECEKELVKGVAGQEDEVPSQARTFSNGLIIEELSMGKPDGKRASPGKKVSVRYIGKLNDGTTFDSNIRGAPPFQFRLGVGQVIKGWDVGVNGMRVGDKRRLTIPPSMGYGSKNMGKIPANSWLLFDVELVDVK